MGSRRLRGRRIGTSRPRSLPLVRGADFRGGWPSASPRLPVNYLPVMLPQHSHGVVGLHARPLEPPKCYGMGAKRSASCKRVVGNFNRVGDPKRTLALMPNAGTLPTLPPATMTSPFLIGPSKSRISSDYSPNAAVGSTVSVGKMPELRRI
jgi:hypothetical protein